MSIQAQRAFWGWLKAVAPTAVAGARPIALLPPRSGGSIRVPLPNPPFPAPPRRS